MPTLIPLTKSQGSCKEVVCKTKAKDPDGLFFLLKVSGLFQSPTHHFIFVIRFPIWKDPKTNKRYPPKPGVRKDHQMYLPDNWLSYRGASNNLKVHVCYMRWLATTILSATQCSNVGTMLQCCVQLKIVIANRPV